MEARAELSPDAVALAQMEGYVIAMPDRQRLPNSLVVLETGEKYKTDLNGRFEFSRLSPGTREIMIVTPGCQVSYTLVELAPWQTRRIGLTVTWSLAMQAAEARRRAAEGLLITSEEIEDMHARRLSDVVRRVAPDMVGASTGPSGEASLRGRGFVTGQGARVPVLVINGMRSADSSTRTMNEIRPEDVAFVEISKGAAGAWSYGSGGAGGVIRITTKDGVRTDAPPMDPELCDVPEWP